MDNPIMDVGNGGKFGIITTEGDIWKEQRRFSLHELRDIGFGKPVIEEKVMTETEKLIQHVLELSGVNSDGSMQHRAVAIKYPLQLCICNIINAVVFDKSFDKNDKVLHELLAIVNEASEISSSPVLGFVISFPFLRHVPLFHHFGYDLFKEFGAKFHDYVQDNIERIQKQKDEGLHKVTSQCLLQAFMTEYEQRQTTGTVGSFDLRQIRSSIIDVFVAGFETTVTTLRYAVLYLVRFKNTQDKLYDEIVQVAGMDRDVSLGDRPNMPYLNAFIAETQRLSTIIPMGVPHRALQDMVTDDNQQIKAGTLLFSPPIVVHHDPHIFKEPLTFNPDRFLGEEKGKMDLVRQFGTGKRQCLGESLARAELFLITANLVKNFEILPVNADKPPPLDMNPKRPFTPTDYYCIFKKRV